MSTEILALVICVGLMSTVVFTMFEAKLGHILKGLVLAVALIYLTAPTATSYLHESGLPEKDAKVIGGASVASDPIVSGVIGTLSNLFLAAIPEIEAQWNDPGSGYMVTSAIHPEHAIPEVLGGVAGGIAIIVIVLMMRSFKRRYIPNGIGGWLIFVLGSALLSLVVLAVLVYNGLGSPYFATVIGFTAITVILRHDHSPESAMILENSYVKYGGLFIGIAVILFAQSYVAHLYPLLDKATNAIGFGLYWRVMLKRFIVIALIELLPPYDGIDSRSWIVAWFGRVLFIAGAGGFHLVLINVALPLLSEAGQKILASYQMFSWIAIIPTVIGWLIIRGGDDEEPMHS